MFIDVPSFCWLGRYPIVVLLGLHARSSTYQLFVGVDAPTAEKHDKAVKSRVSSDE